VHGGVGAVSVIITLVFFGAFWMLLRVPLLQELGFCVGW